MALVIRPMTITDFDAVRALWVSCEGVGLNDADRPEALGPIWTATRG